MSQAWQDPYIKVGSEEAVNTTINTNTWTNYCPHKLPCGYCSLMEKLCIMQPKQYEITCNTTNELNVTDFSKTGG